MTYRIDYNTPEGRAWFRANVPPGFVAIGFACPIDAPPAKLAMFQTIVRDVPFFCEAHANNGQWPGQAPELGVLVVVPVELGYDWHGIAGHYCREYAEDCYLVVRGDDYQRAVFHYPNGHCEFQADWPRHPFAGEE